MEKKIFWAAAAATLAAAPAAAADLVLDAESGFIVPIEVRGQTLRLRADLEAPGYPIINPAAAALLRFGGSMVKARAVVGPVRIRGRTNSAPYTNAGVPRRQRFVWFDRDTVSGADGTISPEDLPYDRVVFRLHPEAAGEVTSTVTLAFQRGTGLFMPITNGGQTIQVQFSTLQPLTLATASTGALLAASLDGSWSGEPRDALIEFGVSRPVRPMRLARPLAFADFALDGLNVRTGDHRGAYELPSDASADPDEIVVTGNLSRQRARLTMTIGLDRLDRCSSLIYERPTRTLTMRCLPL
jgi:hypothetical protein